MLCQCFFAVLKWTGCILCRLLLNNRHDGKGHADACPGIKKKKKKQMSEKSHLTTNNFDTPVVIAVWSNSSYKSEVDDYLTSDTEAEWNQLPSSLICSAKNNARLQRTSSYSCNTFLWQCHPTGPVKKWQSVITLLKAVALHSHLQSNAKQSEGEKTAIFHLLCLPQSQTRTDKTVTLEDFVKSVSENPLLPNSDLMWLAKLNTYSTYKSVMCTICAVM